MVILVVQKPNLCGPVVRHVLITLARHQYFIFVLTKLPARTMYQQPVPPPVYSALTINRALLKKLNKLGK